MLIAIVGGGFAGVATAWHLLNHQPGCKVVIFDPKGIGKGASGISAGLMHPYSGAQAKLNRFGHDAMNASVELLKESLQFHDVLSDQNIYKSNGLLRIALTPEQALCYQTAAIQYPEDITWLSPEETQIKLGIGLKKASIYISPAFEVHPALYLQALWKGCESKGAILEKRSIEDLEELKGFGIIIVAVGGDCQIFPDLKSEHLSYTKGQALELEWPQSVPPLPLPINSHVYIVMKNQNTSCLVGATYERNFVTRGEDIEVARDELMPKAINLIPELAGARIVSVYSGIRVSTPNHMPLIKQFGRNRWLITGFGSKGLLYHALFSRKLVDMIFSI